ncbi:phage tail protein [Enterobacter hormaechei]|uniref:phage tail protein n=1 Tax=Enterobacter hormaechei TaxID=158836 RepID=UPI003D6FF305
MQNLMPPVNTPDKLFHDGDPTQGIEGTIVTAEWLNDSQSATRDAQQEVINVLAGANILPDESKQNQLLTAIQTLITQAVNAAKYVPEVGELFITSKNIDPNTKYPGTTWVYLGEGLNLRTGKADGSDVGTTIGADTVTLAAANLPAHTHSIGGSTGSSTATAATTSSFDYGTKTSSSTDLGTKTTAAFDYGTKTTSSNGDHNHKQRAWRDGGGGSNTYIDRNTFNKAGYEDNSSTTVNAGAHTHTVGIGAHSHSIAMGAHTHTVGIGAHTHTVTVPAHNHTLPANTGSVGSGTSFSVVSKSKLVMVWERTA